MNMKKIASALCIAFAVAVPAYAKTLTIDLATLPASATNLTSLLSIQQFDPTLGTLTGIEIDYSSLLKTDVTLKGVNTVPNKKVTVNAIGSISLKRPDASLVAPVSTATLISAAPFTVNGKETITGITGSNTLSIYALLDGASDLALFTGTGSLTSLFSAQVNVTGAGAAGVLTSFNSTATGYGKVVYTYTAAPVPEPETYGMLLLGLGVVGFAAKRKSRAAKV